MKTSLNLLASIYFSLHTALAGPITLDLPVISKIDPANAMASVSKIITEKLQSELNYSFQMNMLNIETAKYKPGHFGDYNVNIKGHSNLIGLEQFNCYVYVEIQRVHFAKQLNVVILEEVRNDYQIIARVGSLNCEN
jgi:hypothetical protein